jgi:hypothetical protein
MLRSIAAVAAGFLATAVLVTVFDALLMAVVPQWFVDPAAPTVPLLTLPGTVVNLTAGTVGAVIGGYLMALIARQNLMKHLYWLIGVLVLFGLLSATMDAGMGLPLWYSVLVVVLGIAGYYLGVRLYIARRGEAEAPPTPAEV